jgi:hypothetical protein
MIRDGVLSARKIAGETKVTLETINAYLESPRHAGRPRKELTTA